MRILFFLCAFSSALICFTQCGPKEGQRETSLAQIQTYETALKADDGKDGLNKELANDLIAESRSFVDYFPEDSLAAPILFKAADVARGIGEYDLAIKLWDQVNRKFPAFDKAPDALFLKGFVKDKDLADKSGAIAFYEEFLLKYPNHPLVKDVTLLKQYLEMEKTPEELIQEFEQNRGQQQQ